MGWTRRGGRSKGVWQAISLAAISVSFKAAFIPPLLRISSLACLEFKTTRPNCYVPSAFSSSLPPPLSPSLALSNLATSSRFSVLPRGVRCSKLPPQWGRRGKLRASLSTRSNRSPKLRDREKEKGRATW